MNTFVRQSGPSNRRIILRIPESQLVKEQDIFYKYLFVIQNSDLWDKFYKNGLFIFYISYCQVRLNTALFTFFIPKMGNLNLICLCASNNHFEETRLFPFFIPSLSSATSRCLLVVTQINYQTLFFHFSICTQDPFKNTADVSKTIASPLREDRIQFLMAALYLVTL